MKRTRSILCALLHSLPPTSYSAVGSWRRHMLVEHPRCLPPSLIHNNRTILHLTLYTTRMQHSPGPRTQDGAQSREGWHDVAGGKLVDG